MNINFSMPSTAQILAAGRNIASAASGAIGVLVALHFLSADDAGKIGDAFNQINAGLTSLLGGITALAIAAAPFWAAYSSSHSAQIAAVAASPDVQKVVMVSKALADADPSDKVVAPGSPAVKPASIPGLGSSGGGLASGG